MLDNQLQIRLLSKSYLPANAEVRNLDVCVFALTLQICEYQTAVVMNRPQAVTWQRCTLLPRKSVHEEFINAYNWKATTKFGRLQTNLRVKICIVAMQLDSPEQ